MKYLFYLILIIVVPTNIALAGYFNINKNSDFSENKVGDEILLSIEIQTENESYNAVSGNLNIDEGLEIQQVVLRNSVVSAWVTNPSKATSNNISFAGIIAGGLQGSGTLFEVVAVPKYDGNFNINLSQSSLFKNDGLGTEEIKENKNLNLQVRNLFPGENNNKLNWQDKTAPEYFEAILVKDENISENKYVIIFEAIDKGSGIRSYDILEGKKLFEQVESPYVLKNQKINEKIYVKARDYYGNERVVRVDVPNRLCFGIKCFNQNIVIPIITFVFLLFLFIWRKQAKEFKKIEEKIS